MPIVRLVAIVFIISLSVRILLDLTFFLRYGWHASNVIEVWFYYGVAKGIFVLKSLDPTLWLLRVVGYILPEKFLFYGVVLTAGILSAVTAVIISLLGTELDSKKTGFFAGVLYATLVQPIGLSVVSFTHDLVQLPIIALCILLLIRATKTPDVRERLLNSALFAALLYLGWHINQLITIALDVAILFLGLKLFYYLGEKRSIDRKRIFLYYFVVVTLGILALRLTLLPDVFNEVFGRMTQGRTGSIDVAPISAGSLWIRYNFLLLLMPLGLIYTYRRRDITSYSLFLLGLVISTLVDRGARIADLGVCLLAARAFTQWESKDEKELALGFLLVVPLALSFLDFSLFLNIFFMIISISLYLLLKSERQRTQFPSIFLALIIIAGAITFNGIASPEFIRESATTDSEYRALDHLKGVSKGDGRIHINWVYGYFAGAVSGVRPASSPGRINREIFKTGWQTEEISAEKFREEGIEYVMVTTRDFEITGEDPIRDIASFKISRGIIFKPKSARISSLKETTIYKMLYDEGGLNNFEKIYEEEDRTGLVVKIYKVL